MSTFNETQAMNAGGTGTLNERLMSAKPATIATSGQPAPIGPTAAGSQGLAADAGHVHAFGSALQRNRLAVPAQVGPSVSWTFDTPFVDSAGNSVLPSMACLIECPSTGMVFDEPQITALTNTGCTVLVRCTNSTLTVAGVLPISLTLGAASVPANTFVHLSARNPTV